MFNIYEPQFWVSLAFIVFVALCYKKLVEFLAGFLDGHANKIKSELDAARNLRIEAEETLALYRKKQIEFSKEAEDILAKARADAETNTMQAQTELKTALDTRLKQAMEKIAQEEAAAIADVRNHIVNLALNTARTIIAEQTSKSTQSELIKHTISDIEQKIH